MYCIYTWRFLATPGAKLRSDRCPGCAAPVPLLCRPGLLLSSLSLSPTPRCHQTL